ncbi:MAG: TIGR00730 family Rossman fold protein [Candidatus Nomurabacteria bacterium]|jgi:uncharacterized protein (TIGR00730 family)|nr:TIGR00730 family Rossman fold protein [Candidatus Nomurabacteria bacterium]
MHKFNVADVDRLRSKLNESNYRRALRYAEDTLGGLKKLEDFEQGVAIFGSSRPTSSDKMYKTARQLGRKLAKAGHNVITGGAQGIMEAANRGAFEAGGTSIGLNIKLPHEQHLNKYTTIQMEFRYFFARKVMLVASSKAYVFVPGGFGTLDEFSEIVTMIQTDKIPPAPLMLVGSDFWQPVDNFFLKTVQQQRGYISPNDRMLYTITDDVDLVVDAVNSVSRVGISAGLATVDRV